MVKNVNEIDLKKQLFNLILQDEIDEEAINQLELIAKEQNLETEFLKTTLTFRIVHLCSMCITTDAMLNTTKEDELIKEEIYNYYERVLKHTIVLAKELGLKNSLEYSNLFSCLLWKGYFSLNHIHNYSTSNRNLSFNDNGMEVLKGTGVCLNYSQMLKDFLQLANFPSSNVFCTVNKNISFDYFPRIKRRIDTNSLQINKKEALKDKLEKLVMLNARLHLVNLNTLENGSLYLYDPTNIGILKLKNNKKANIINGKGTFRLKPITSFIFLSENLELETLQLLYILKSFNSSLTKETFLDSFKNCNELFNTSPTIFKDYRHDILNDIEKANILFEKQKVKTWNY